MEKYVTGQKRFDLVIKVFKNQFIPHFLDNNFLAMAVFVVFLLI